MPSLKEAASSFFQTIKSVGCKGREPSQIETVDLGPFSVIVDHHGYPDARRPVYLRDIRAQLDQARLDGLKPISLKEILARVGSLKPNQEVVVFDMTSSLYPGNYWRILGIETDQEDNTYVILQHCNPFGTYDNAQILPTGVPVDTIMATGYATQTFSMEGAVGPSITPADIRTAIKNGKSLPGLCREEEICWSTPDGWRNDLPPLPLETAPNITPDSTS